MMERMQWKDYIAAIIETGLTQKQLAQQAGCGQATISDIASGKTRDPRSSIGLAIWRVGKRLGIKAVPAAPNPQTAQEREVTHG